MPMHWMNCSTSASWKSLPRSLCMSESAFEGDACSAYGREDVSAEKLSTSAAIAPSMGIASPLSPFG